MNYFRLKETNQQDNWMYQDLGFSSAIQDIIGTIGEI